MLDLVDEDATRPARPRQCHRCGKQFPPDVAVCIECGVDLATGRLLETRTEPILEEGMDDSDPGLAYRFLMLAAEYCPGFFLPKVLLASILLTAMGAAVLALCIFLFLLGAVLTAFPVGAAGFVLYAQAIAWMLTGQFAFLSENLSEMDGKRMTLFLSILLLPLGAGYLWLNLHQH